MARATSTTQSILSLSNAQLIGATTVTIETSSSSSNQQKTPITESLVLKLKRPKKKVSWKEGTVDNELMNKRSSKKCCIFHKEKSFDEDDSDCDDFDGGKDKDDDSHNYEGNDDSCCHGILGD